MSSLGETKEDSHVFAVRAVRPEASPAHGSGDPRPAGEASDSLGETVEEGVARSASSPEPERKPTARRRGPRSVRAAGERVGRYIVLGVLGSGGMGVVYTAYDPKLDRKVALKVLHADRSHSPEASLRLLAEAQALARVTHPNVVAVHDVGQVGGSNGNEIYIGMELVEGRTLNEWRREDKRSWPAIVAMFLQIAEALAAVHAAGFVHRDVKPDNVLVDSKDRARVTDFGLARPIDLRQEVLEERERELVAGDEALTPTDLTRSGARLGTPAYMAPEQWEGKGATPLSDQFSLCVAFWESLYGVRPFRGDTIAALMAAVLAGEISSPTQAGTVTDASRTRPEDRRSTTTPTSSSSDTPIQSANPPAWLRRVLERGLATDPAQRHPDLGALMQALRNGDPLRRRRTVIAGTCIAVGLLGAASLAVVAAALEERELAASCEAQAQAVDWTEERKSKLREHLAAAGVRDAEQTADGVITKLQGFVDAYGPLTRDTCMSLAHAQAPAPELEHTAQCLSERQSAFEATVAALEEGDASVSGRAPRSVEGIDDLSACTDPQKFQRRPAAPRDPLRRAIAGEIRRTLARTLVDEHVGTYARGLEMAQRQLEAARVVGDLSLLALAQYRVAVFQEKLGQYKEATASWTASYRDAAISGYEDLAADASTALGFCEGYQLQRYELGLRWLELAAIHRTRLGETDGLKEANRLDVMATLHESLGDLDLAVSLLEQSIAMRRAAVGDHHHSVGYGLANLGGVYETRGELDKARALVAESLEIFVDHFGEENPTTGEVLNNLAGIDIKLERFADAEAALTRVRANWTAALGPKHPKMGNLDNALADVMHDQGRFEEAIELHRRALAIHLEANGDAHPNTARTATRLADVLYEVGKSQEARVVIDQALEILGRSDGDDQEAIAKAWVRRAETDVELGERTTARQDAETALSLMAALGDPPSGWVARAKAVRVWAGDRDAQSMVSAGSDGFAELLVDPKLPSDARAKVLRLRALMAKEPAVRIADMQAAMEAAGTAARWIGLRTMIQRDLGAPTPTLTP